MMKNFAGNPLPLQLLMLIVSATFFIVVGWVGGVSIWDSLLSLVLLVGIIFFMAVVVPWLKARSLKPMETMEDFQNEIISLGLAKPGELMGCSQEEIARLMLHQGVNHLPPFYREFLERMGKNSGKYQIGARFLFDDLFFVKEHAQAVARNEGWGLSDDAFVFAEGTDDEFLFFQVGEGKDPPVYMIEDHIKKKFADTFQIVLGMYLFKVAQTHFEVAAK